LIRPGIVFGIARAEARLTRRLVRYWVFIALAALVTAVIFAWNAVIHYNFSAVSASAASANPRFWVASFAWWFLITFSVGLIFLGYDLRARDRRERMAEVLDAQPYSNLELILGRFLGLFVAAWIPAIGIIVGLQIVGSILGWPVEPWSMLGMALFMTVPAFVFLIGLVYLVTLLLGHRLVAALVLVGFIAGIFVLTGFLVPLWGLSAIDYSGAFVQPLPSDIVPAATDAAALLNRAGFLLAGVGLLWLAAAAYPRRDEASRAVRTAVGATLVLAGAALVAVPVLQQRGAIEQRAGWLEAHRARRDDPVPDLRRVSGEVKVIPGRSLQMELTLDIAARDDRPLEFALFSLNPGLHVGEARLGTQALDIVQADGLLQLNLPRPLRPGDTASLQLSIAGRPDPAFPYLDATIEPLKLTSSDANLLLLGNESVLFDRRFVALLPGLRWLPTPGPEAGPEGSAARPGDFFDVDLTVELPRGWLVAGPGRREELGAAADADTVRFRFLPPATVPEVALVAGRFESRATEIDGVTAEVLFHPGHAGNFEIFEEAGEEIRSWLQERLEEAAEMGLAYPYDALTLVEVPIRLRGFGGGWRMDTTLAQPAMILLREISLPTARFNARFDDPERWASLDGGLPEYMRRTLDGFFDNDINGGNAFVAASRSFFTYQTAGSGAEAVPLDYVCENLLTKLLAEKEGYFSVHFFDRNFGQKFGQAASMMRSPERYSDSYAEVLVRLVTSRAEVWDTLLETSLGDLDPWEDPAKTIDVLSLKGGAMASSLRDKLGPEKTGQLLGVLRERNAGGTFSRDDLLAAGHEVGQDLEDWLGLWLDQTALPGFAVGQVHVDRISDGDDGTPRYQSRLTLRNDESVPGLLLVEYTAGERQSGLERGDSGPVEVPATSAVEIGLVSSKPPTRLRVRPYLALNREPFTVPLPGLDEERIVEAEPFQGAREALWTRPDNRAVLVDDLDAGFGVEEQARGKLRVSGDGADVETDQGLPVWDAGRIPQHWSRTSRSTAWGKYRRTLAVVRSGSGDRLAVFTTQIPNGGPWQLEYHLPDPSRQGRNRGLQRGKWNMNLVHDSGSESLTFDANAADSGWNTLGTFDIEAGEVRLEVSNETDGRYVLADAIRWTPLFGDTPVGASL